MFYIDSVLLLKEHLLIIGDLNIHVDVPEDPHAVKFLDMKKFKIQKLPRVDRYFSDHASLDCDLRIKRPVSKVKMVTYRKLKSVNMADLRNNLASSDLCTNVYSERRSPDDLEKLVENYGRMLSRLINYHAPIKTKRVTTRPQVPLYNEEIALAKDKDVKTKRPGEGPNKHRTSRSLRKGETVTLIIHKAQTTFYTDFVDDDSCDLGKLFRGMKALLVPKDNLYVPDYSDNRALAVDIGGFFCRKINNIRNELGIIRAAMKEEDRVEDDPVVMENQRIYEFRQLSCGDVCSLIQKSAKKTCTLDPIPTSMVVD